MKKLLVFVAASLLLASCGMLSSTPSQSTTTTTTTTPAATTASTSNPAATQGQTAGNAIKNIYAQYKADGKFDISNMNNIANTALLIGSCQGLKSNAKDSNYWKSFTSGLILGSDQLVKEDIADAVTQELQTLVVEKVGEEKIDNATTQATSAISNISAAASSISTIVSLFK